MLIFLSLLMSLTAVLCGCNTVDMPHRPLPIPLGFGESGSVMLQIDPTQLSRVDSLDTVLVYLQDARERSVLGVMEMLGKSPSPSAPSICVHSPYHARERAWAFSRATTTSTATERPSTGSSNSITLADITAVLVSDTDDGMAGLVNVSVESLGGVALMLSKLPAAPPTLRQLFAWSSRLGGQAAFTPREQAVLSVGSLTYLAWELQGGGFAVDTALLHGVDTPQVLQSCLFRSALLSGVWDDPPPFVVPTGTTSLTATIPYYSTNNVDSLLRSVFDAPEAQHGGSQVLTSPFRLTQSICNTAKEIPTLPVPRDAVSQSVFTSTTIGADVMAVLGIGARGTDGPLCQYLQVDGSTTTASRTPVTQWVQTWYGSLDTYTIIAFRSACATASNTSMCSTLSRAPLVAIHSPSGSSSSLPSSVPYWVSLDASIAITPLGSALGREGTTTRALPIPSDKPSYGNDGSYNRALMLAQVELADLSDLWYANSTLQMTLNIDVQFLVKESQSTNMTSTPSLTATNATHNTPVLFTNGSHVLPCRVLSTKGVYTNKSLGSTVFCEMGGDVHTPTGPIHITTSGCGMGTLFSLYQLPVGYAPPPNSSLRVATFSATKVVYQQPVVTPMSTSNLSGLIEHVLSHVAILRGITAAPPTGLVIVEFSAIYVPPVSDVVRVVCSLSTGTIDEDLLEVEQLGGDASSTSVLLCSSATSSTDTFPTLTLHAGSGVHITVRIRVNIAVQASFAVGLESILSTTSSLTSGHIVMVSSNQAIPANKMKEYSNQVHFNLQRYIATKGIKSITLQFRRPTEGVFGWPLANASQWSIPPSLSSAERLSSGVVVVYFDFKSDSPLTATDTSLLISTLTTVPASSLIANVSILPTTSSHPLRINRPIEASHFQLPPTFLEELRNFPTVWRGYNSSLSPFCVNAIGVLPPRRSIPVGGVPSFPLLPTTSMAAYWIKPLWVHLPSYTTTTPMPTTTPSPSTVDTILNLGLTVLQFQSRSTIAPLTFTLTGNTTNPLSALNHTSTGGSVLLTGFVLFRDIGPIQLEQPCQNAICSITSTTTAVCSCVFRRRVTYRTFQAGVYRVGIRTASTGLLISSVSVNITVPLGTVELSLTTVLPGGGATLILRAEYLPRVDLFNPCTTPVQVWLGNRTLVATFLTECGNVSRSVAAALGGIPDYADVAVSDPYVQFCLQKYPAMVACPIVFSSSLQLVCIVGPFNTTVLQAAGSLGASPTDVNTKDRLAVSLITGLNYSSVNATVTVTPGIQVVPAKLIPVITGMSPISVSALEYPIISVTGFNIEAAVVKVCHKYANSSYLSVAVRTCEDCVGTNRSESVITCIVQKRLPVGYYDVLLQTPDGSSPTNITLTSYFKLFSAGPSVISQYGGVTLTLTGVGFTSSTSEKASGARTASVNYTVSTTVDVSTFGVVFGGVYTCVISYLSHSVVECYLPPGNYTTTSTSPLEVTISPLLPTSSLSSVSTSSDKDESFRCGTGLEVGMSNYTYYYPVNGGVVTNASLYPPNYNPNPFITHIPQPVPTLSTPADCEIRTSTGQMPRITSVYPGTAPSGELITISGWRFSVVDVSRLHVIIGDSTACAILERYYDRIVCKLIGHCSAGLQQVNMYVDGGGYAEVPEGGISFYCPMTVTGVNPTQGSCAGGQTVTVSGYGFTSSDTVLLAGKACGVVSASPTSIVCVTGTSGALATTSGVVRVTSENGAASKECCKYTYSTAFTPLFNSITPTTGSEGTRATILGSGLGNAGIASVVINGVQTTDTVILSNTTINLLVPRLPGGTSFPTLHIEGWGYAWVTDPSQDIFFVRHAVSSVSPTSMGYLGGPIVSLIGSSFTVDDDDLTGGTTIVQQTSVEATICGRQCVVSAVKFNEVDCRSPAAVDTRLLSEYPQLPTIHFHKWLLPEVEMATFTYNAAMGSVRRVPVFNVTHVDGMALASGRTKLVSEYIEIPGMARSQTTSLTTGLNTRVVVLAARTHSRLAVSTIEAEFTTAAFKAVCHLQVLGTSFNSMDVDTAFSATTTSTTAPIKAAFTAPVLAVNSSDMYLGNISAPSVVWRTQGVISATSVSTPSLPLLRAGRIFLLKCTNVPDALLIKSIRVKGIPLSLDESSGQCPINVIVRNVPTGSSPALLNTSALSLPPSLLSSLGSSSPLLSGAAYSSASGSHSCTSPTGSQCQQLSYAIDTTPVINSIFPFYALLDNSTRIKLNGNGFGLTTAGMTISLDGIPCIPTTTRSDAIECDTRPRQVSSTYDATNPRSQFDTTVQVYIPSKGYSLMTIPQTFTATRSWASKHAWRSERVPTVGTIAVIEKGFNVLMDVTPPPLSAVLVKGTLVFPSRASDLSGGGLELHAMVIVVLPGGSIKAGTEASPQSSRVSIVIHGGLSIPLDVIDQILLEAADSGVSQVELRRLLQRRKGLLVLGGSIVVYGGSTVGLTSTLKTSAAAGDLSISVTSRVSWSAGDFIMIGGNTAGAGGVIERMIDVKTFDSADTILTLNTALQHPLTVRTYIDPTTSRVLESTLSVVVSSRLVVLRSAIDDDALLTASLVEGMRLKSNTFTTSSSCNTSTSTNSSTNSGLSSTRQVPVMGDQGCHLYIDGLGRSDAIVQLSGMEIRGCGSTASAYAPGAPPAPSVTIQNVDSALVTYTSIVQSFGPGIAFTNCTHCAMRLSVVVNTRGNGISILGGAALGMEVTSNYIIGVSSHLGMQYYGPAGAAPGIDVSPTAAPILFTSAVADTIRFGPVAGMYVTHPSVVISSNVISCVDGDGVWLDLPSRASYPFADITSMVGCPQGSGPFQASSLVISRSRRHGISITPHFFPRTNPNSQCGSLSVGTTYFAVPSNVPVESINTAFAESVIDSISIFSLGGDGVSLPSMGGVLVSNGLFVDISGSGVGQKPFTRIPAARIDKGFFVASTVDNSSFSRVSDNTRGFYGRYRRVGAGRTGVRITNGYVKITTCRLRGFNSSDYVITTCLPGIVPPTSSPIHGITTATDSNSVLVVGSAELVQIEEGQRGISLCGLSAFQDFDGLISGKSEEGFFVSGSDYLRQLPNLCVNAAPFLRNTTSSPSSTPAVLYCSTRSVFKFHIMRFYSPLSLIQRSLVNATIVVAHTDSTIASTSVQKATPTADTPSDKTVFVSLSTSGFEEGDRAMIMFDGDPRTVGLTGLLSSAEVAIIIDMRPLVDGLDDEYGRNHTTLLTIQKSSQWATTAAPRLVADWSYLEAMGQGGASFPFPEVGGVGAWVYREISPAVGVDSIRVPVIDTTTTTFLSVLSEAESVNGEARRTVSSTPSLSRLRQTRTMTQTPTEPHAHLPTPVINKATYFGIPRTEMRVLSGYTSSAVMVNVAYCNRSESWCSPPVGQAEGITLGGTWTSSSHHSWQASIPPPSSLLDPPIQGPNAEEDTTFYASLDAFRSSQTTCLYPLGGSRTYIIPKGTTVRCNVRYYTCIEVLIVRGTLILDPSVAGGNILIEAGTVLVESTGKLIITTTTNTTSTTTSPSGDVSDVWSVRIVLDPLRFVSFASLRRLALALNSSLSTTTFPTQFSEMVFRVPCTGSNCLSVTALTTIRRGSISVVGAGVVDAQATSARSSRYLGYYVPLGTTCTSLASNSTAVPSSRCMRAIFAGKRVVATSSTTSTGAAGTIAPVPPTSEYNAITLSGNTSYPWNSSHVASRAGMPVHMVVLADRISFQRRRDDGPSTPLPTPIVPLSTAVTTALMSRRLRSSFTLIPLSTVSTTGSSTTVVSSPNVTLVGVLLLKLGSHKGASLDACALDIYAPSPIVSISHSTIFSTLGSAICVRPTVSGGSIFISNTTVINVTSVAAAQASAVRLSSPSLATIITLQGVLLSDVTYRAVGVDVMPDRAVPAPIPPSPTAIDDVPPLTAVCAVTINASAITLRGLVVTSSPQFSGICFESCPSSTSSVTADLLVYGGVNGVVFIPASPFDVSTSTCQFTNITASSSRFAGVLVLAKQSISLTGLLLVDNVVGVGVGVHSGALSISSSEIVGSSCTSSSANTINPSVDGCGFHGSSAMVGHQFDLRLPSIRYQPKYGWHSPCDLLGGDGRSTSQAGIVVLPPLLRGSRSTGVTNTSNVTASNPTSSSAPSSFSSSSIGFGTISGVVFSNYGSDACPAGFFRRVGSVLAYANMNTDVLRPINTRFITVTGTATTSMVTLPVTTPSATYVWDLGGVLSQTNITAMLMPVSSSAAPVISSTCISYSSGTVGARCVGNAVGLLTVEGADTDPFFGPSTSLSDQDALRASITVNGQAAQTLLTCGGTRHLQVGEDALPRCIAASVGSTSDGMNQIGSLLDDFPYRSLWRLQSCPEPDTVTLFSGYHSGYLRVTAWKGGTILQTGGSTVAAGSTAFAGAHYFGISRHSTTSEASRQPFQIALSCSSDSTTYFEVHRLVRGYAAIIITATFEYINTVGAHEIEARFATYFNLSSSQVSITSAEPVSSTTTYVILAIEAFDSADYNSALSTLAINAVLDALLAANSVEESRVQLSEVLERPVQRTLSVVRAGTRVSITSLGGGTSYFYLLLFLGTLIVILVIMFIVWAGCSLWNSRVIRRTKKARAAVHLARDTSTTSALIPSKPLPVRDTDSTDSLSTRSRVYLETWFLDPAVYIIEKIPHFGDPLEDILHENTWAVPNPVGEQTESWEETLTAQIQEVIHAGGWREPPSMGSSAVVSPPPRDVYVPSTNHPDDGDGSGFVAFQSFRGQPNRSGGGVEATDSLFELHPDAASSPPNGSLNAPRKDYLTPSSSISSMAKSSMMAKSASKFLGNSFNRGYLDMSENRPALTGWRSVLNAQRNNMEQSRIATGSGRHGGGGSMSGTGSGGGVSGFSGTDTLALARTMLGKSVLARSVVRPTNPASSAMGKSVLNQASIPKAPPSTQQWPRPSVRSPVTIAVEAKDLQEWSLSEDSKVASSPRDEGIANASSSYSPPPFTVDPPHHQREKVMQPTPPLQRQKGVPPTPPTLPVPPHHHKLLPTPPTPPVSNVPEHPGVNDRTPLTRSINNTIVGKGHTSRVPTLQSPPLGSPTDSEDFQTRASQNEPDSIVPAIPTSRKAARLKSKNRKEGGGTEVAPSSAAPRRELRKVKRSTLRKRAADTPPENN